MNVLLVNTLYFPYKVGGAEKSVQILAEELATKGHTVNVLTLMNGKELDRKACVNNVNVHRLSLSNIYWPFLKTTNRKNISKLIWHTFEIFNVVMMFKVMIKLYKLKPDLVHTNNIHGFSVAVWVACKLFKKPIVHTMRDYYLSCNSLTRYKSKKRCAHQCLSCQIFSFPKQQASRLVDLPVGISNFMSVKHISEGYYLKGASNTTVYNVANW
ncbi:glycosyltransferase [Psychromonas sp. KJ10-10]|uniref:glycosyltransferase n=1 Tax=Psychromonas sp. KJ10-10 TaxID=3391823 RepID=UPI0039B5FC67